MKEDFDNYEKQGRYILRFMNNSTDVKKICQICGKPATLVNNVEDPYKIQLLCVEHRKGLYQREMAEGVPLIDLKEHIISKNLKNKIINLNEEYIRKIQVILKANPVMTKKQVLSYLDVTLNGYNKIISQYKEEVDGDIISKLEDIYSRARFEINKSTSLNRTVRTKVGNNISMIKAEKGITNKEIIKKCRGEITACTISLIASGKTKATEYSRALLSEALGCSIAEVFPENKKFNNVYTLDDYIFLCKYIKEKLQEDINTQKNHGNNRAMTDLAEKLGISLNKVYNVYSLNKAEYPKLSYSDIVTYMCYFEKVSEEDLEININKLMEK